MKIKKELKKIFKNIIIYGVIYYITFNSVIMYYFPPKNKIDKKNLFKGNIISASDEEVNDICNKLEKEWRIEISDDLKDEYLILDAINKNESFSEYKNYYIHAIINLIKDNQYLNKEDVYTKLLNVNIGYKKRPFFLGKRIGGVYYEPNNSIAIFEEYQYKELILHEIIHCIFYKNNSKLPRFFMEGMTQLLSNEYGDNNNTFYKNEKLAYQFEITAVKMLCEITSPETVLKAFTLNNMNYITDEMIKGGITKKEAEESIKIIDNVLNSLQDEKKHKYSVNEFYEKCILKFRNYIDYKYEKNDSNYISYYYNEMLFYNCLFKDTAYSNYFKDIEKYGYDYKVYFSNYLKFCINRGIHPYNEFNDNINNKKILIKKYNQH